MIDEGDSEPESSLAVSEIQGVGEEIPNAVRSIYTKYVFGPGNTQLALSYRRPFQPRFRVPLPCKMKRHGRLTGAPCPVVRLIPPLDTDIVPMANAKKATSLRLQQPPPLLSGSSRPVGR
ncbi:hypothetical protein FALCPG4_003519 [Fusarium falciforme]